LSVERPNCSSRRNFASGRIGTVGVHDWRCEKEDLYMAIEIVKVKVRPLSREAMKPYGDILDEDHPILPTVDLNFVEVIERTSEF